MYGLGLVGLTLAVNLGRGGGIGLVIAISDHPSSARTMRSIAPCIVGLTLAVNLGRGGSLVSPGASP
ncbi:MAG: hypothetical protein E6I80_24535 [Chloroflexi bacterium]|nr:MAG: hypothetical protein E6I80_24535 [Chloroflexota bacterium]